MRSFYLAAVCFGAALTFTPLPAYAQDTQARLANLEARVAKLEGDIVAADLVGLYRGAGLITDLDGGSPASVEMFAQRGTLRLRADGTGFFRARGGGVINLIEGSPWTDAASPLPRDEEAITWSYADRVLRVTDGTPNTDIRFDVGAGGRVLILGGLSDDNTADLFVLTRLR